MALTEKILGGIEKARTKSERTRHMISLGLAGAFTFVLFLIWAFVLLPYQFSNVANAPSDANNSPFASLKAQVSGAYDDFMNSIHNQFQNFNGNNTQSWQNQYQKIKSEAQTPTQDDSQPVVN